MSPSTKPTAAPFTRDVWKRYTALQERSFGRLLGMRTREWLDVEEAMEAVFATSSEEAMDRLVVAFGSWKRRKAKDHGVHYAEVLDAVARNKDGFLNEIDDWLYNKRGVEISLDAADVAAMRACSLQQSLQNLAIARVTFHEVNRAKITAKAAEAKQAIDDAKAEAKDAAKEEAKERIKQQLREWVSGFIGREWVQKLATWQGVYDDLLAAAINRMLAELGLEVVADTISTILATSIPGAATIVSGARFLKATNKLVEEKRRLTLVAVRRTCDETTVTTAQAAMEDCGRRLVMAEAKETARSAAQVAASAVSDFATLGIGNVFINSATKIGVAMTRLCELKYLVETAAVECHHANEILAATRAAPSPPTIRELIVACPIVGCHFIRTCCTAVLFDDFVLAAGRFRYFAVGEVMPYFDQLRAAAGHYCDTSLLTIERAPAPGGVESLPESPVVAAVEPVSDLIPDALPGVVATLVVTDAAIDEAVTSVIENRAPPMPAPARSEECLQLERRVAKAISEYKQTLSKLDTATVTKGVQFGRGTRMVARVSAETEAAIAYFESADFKTDMLGASMYRVAFQPMRNLIGKLVREPNHQTLVEDFSYSASARQLLPLTAGGKFATILRANLERSALLPKQATKAWYSLG